jgi:ankyrin repeat protein
MLIQLNLLYDQSDSFLSDFIGRDSDYELQKFKFQINKAKDFIRFVKLGESIGIGGEHPFDSKIIQPCGLTAQEILAISYLALNDSSAWGAYYNQNKNSYLCGFIKSLYVAMRGRNVDDYGKDQDFANHKDDADEIKCNEGVVNQVVQGLLGHCDISLRIVNSSTMSNELSANILKVLKDLSPIAENLDNADEISKQNLTDINHWLSTGIMPNKVKQNIIRCMKNPKYNFNNYSSSELSLYASSAIANIDIKFVQEQIKKDIDAIKIFDLKKTSLFSFIIDSKKGYIPYLEHKEDDNEKDVSATSFMPYFLTEPPKEYDPFETRTLGQYANESSIKTQQLAVIELLFYSTNDNFIKFISKIANEEIPYLSDHAIQLNMNNLARNGFYKLFIIFYNKNRYIDLKEPLDLAMQGGHINITLFLTNKHPELIKYIASSNDENLSNSLSNGHIDIVNYLLKIDPCNIDYITNKYHFLIEEATKEGHLSIIKFLIELQNTNNSNEESEKNQYIEIIYNKILNIASANGHILIIKYLIKIISDKNIPIEHNAIINTAIEKNYIDIVRYLIERTKEQNISIEYNNLLKTGVENNCLSIVKYLIELTFEDVSIFFQQNISLFYSAIKIGSTDIVKYFIRIYPSNIRELTIDNSNIFNIAMKYKKLEIVKFLIDNRVFIISNEEKISIIKIALAQQELFLAMIFMTEEIFATLEKNITNEILIYMAANGKADMLKKCLLAHSISDETIIKNLLEISITNFHPDTTLMLFNIYINIIDDTTLHNTLMEVVIKDRYYLLDMILNKADNPSDLTFYIHIPLDSEDEIYDSLSILEIAILNNNTRITSYLFDNGFELPKKEDNQITALYLAVQNNNLEITSLLINKGINLSHKYHDKTALHLAVENNNIKITELLVSKGINLLDKYNGKTALEIAIETSQDTITYCLLNNTNDIDFIDIFFKILIEEITNQSNNNFIIESIINTTYKIMQNNTLPTPKIQNILNNLIIYTEILLQNYNKNNDFSLLSVIIRSNLYQLFEERNLISVLWLANSNLPDNSLESFLNKLQTSELTIKSKATNSNKQTILHKTLINNNTSSANHFLTAFKELLNIQDEYGATALHYAVLKNNLRMVRNLLNQEDIDLTLTLKVNNFTALDLARSLKLENVIDEFLHKEKKLMNKIKKQTWVEKTNSQTSKHKEL